MSIEIITIVILLIIIAALLVTIIYFQRKNNNMQLENDKRQLKLEKKIDKINEVLSFQQSFNIQLQKSNNNKFKLKGEESNLRSDYLLLLFSKNVKINLLLLRINLFRKIINTLLSKLIDNNFNSLRKTANKFNDILKPSANNIKFFIIYCKDNNINNVSNKKINIIIDFMMFIHNYTSEKIHFNKNQNIPEIFSTIRSEQNSENSDIKTDTSFNPYELIDFIFNEYDLEKDMKKLIDNTYKELKEEDVLGSNILNQEDEKKIKNTIEKGKENNNANEDGKEKNELKGKDEKEKKIQNNEQKSMTKRNKKNKKNKRNKRKNKKEKDDVNAGNNNREEKNGNNSEEEKINNNNQNEKYGNNVNEPVKNINNAKEENISLDKEEDINNNKHKNESHNIPKNFEKFINSFKENFDESEIEIIKNIYDNSNHNDYSIKENIQLLKELKNDSIAISNRKNFYNINIMNFKFENIEEYSIEKMYEIYKLNFDIKSSIYTGFNGEELSKHYRFNSSYSKLIDINIINSYKLSDLKDDLKKIINDDLINLLLEDKGKFGFKLDMEDIN